MSKADLHIHSTASDGHFTPEEIVELAVDRDLHTIAITDHDTVNGYVQAAPKAEQAGLDLIAGAEITGDFNGRESHVLAYGMDVQHDGFVRLLEGQRRLRYERAQGMIRNLNGMGLDISMEEVLAEARTTAIGRVHMARVLLQKQYAGTMQEVFLRYLGDHCSGYHKSPHLPVEEVIEQIHEAGGVAVLAHPADHYNFIELKQYLDAAIDGVECIHPSHDYRLQVKYREYARQHGLLVTGGSDFHGARKQELLKFGVIAVALEYADALKEGISERNKLNSYR